jgi:CRISPR-associated protein Cmr2
MNLEDWLQIQQQHYQQLSEGFPPGAFHPVSGEWQNDPNLADNIKNQFWWGGGATKFACNQLEGEEFSDKSFVFVTNLLHRDKDLK